MNIKPQEVTENGERTVRYKGSDGKFHNIAAGSQGSQQGASSTAQQSVEVGTASVVDYRPTITVDELLPDRFYRIVCDNGNCILATQTVDGQLAISIIGNTRQGIDSEVVETITQDEQDRWVITLSGNSTNPVMTLLSEHDMMKELTLNHQDLFEDFLNYTLIGSVTYDNHGGHFGSFTQTNDGWIICDKDVAGRNGTLTLAINQGMGYSEKKLFKTFRLSNYTASVGTFRFFEQNGKLMMTDSSGDIIWGMSIFKLSGILGTLASYADEAHVRKVNWNQWLEPANGAKIILFGEDSYIDVYSTISDSVAKIILFGEDSYIDVYSTISDSVYIEESIALNGKGYFLLEYLCLPDESMPSGYSCFIVVNGKPTVLTQKERNTHGGA